MSRFSKKGIYAIITTFLFIIIILFAVLYVVYYGSVIVTHRVKVNDDIFKFSILSDVLTNLHKCFGETFSETKLDAGNCSISQEIINGFTVETVPYGNCPQKNWSYLPNLSDSSITEIFLASVEIDGRVCLGKVKVFV